MSPTLETREESSLDDAPVHDRYGGDGRPSAAVAQRPGARGWRRFARFNLLTFLVAFLLLTTYLGMRQRFVVSSAEHAAAARLSDQGADLVYVPAGPAWTQYAFLQFGDDFRHVDSVSIATPQGTIVPPPTPRTSVPDDWLAELPKLSRLKNVTLAEQPVTDATLAPLARCVTLRYLDLTGTNVNDAGIESLRPLQELRSIRIAGTPTSDRALEILADFPELTSIAIDDSTTARGIETLSRMSKLTHVDATATRLRSEDVKPLLDRGIEVRSNGDAFEFATLDESGDEADAFAFDFVAIRRSPWFDAGAYRLTVYLRDLADEAFLRRLDKTHDTLSVEFAGGVRPSDELLASLVSDPRVVEVKLACDGPPWSREEVDRMLSKRPAEARPCRVQGYVSTSGEELLAEFARPRLPYNPFMCRGYSHVSLPVHDLDDDCRARASALGISIRGDLAEWTSPTGGAGP